MGLAARLHFFLALEEAALACDRDISYPRVVVESSIPVYKHTGAVWCGGGVCGRDCTFSARHYLRFDGTRGKIHHRSNSRCIIFACLSQKICFFKYINTGKQP